MEGQRGPIGRKQAKKKKVEGWKRNAKTTLLQTDRTSVTKVKGLLPLCGAFHFPGARS